MHDGLEALGSVGGISFGAMDLKPSIEWLSISLDDSENTKHILSQIY